MEKLKPRRIIKLARTRRDPAGHHEHCPEQRSPQARKFVDLNCIRLSCEQITQPPQPPRGLDRAQVEIPVVTETRGYGSVPAPAKRAIHVSTIYRYHQCCDRLFK